MKFIRPFIVVHSLEDYNFNQPIVIFIDKIVYVTPRIVDDKKVDGTCIFAENWVANVQESIGDVMKKIKEQEYDT